MTHYCPSCGYNLTTDPVIEVGEWRLTPVEVWRGGQPVRLTRGQVGILYTIAAARGRWVSNKVIATRVGDAEDPDNLVRAQMSKMRRRHGADWLKGVVETQWGMGYRWVV